MAFPAVRALKSGRPDLELTVLAPGKLAQLWQSVVEVDSIISKEARSSIGAVAKEVSRRGPFDAAILLTNSPRSTLELWWAGIPRLVGYRGSLRSRLLDDVVSEPQAKGPPEHHAIRYLNLARHCGAKVDAAASLGEAKARITSPMRRVGICAGAEYGQAKRWPLERFAQVARGVSAQRGEVDWLLFGAPGETAMGEELSAQLDGVRHNNLVGKTYLDELIAQLQTCCLLLTNDTGTMHLAAALGIPTVSIFGSTEPVLTGPLGPLHRVVRHHVPCSPCFRRECPFGHYDCMNGVTVERVTGDVLRALAE